MRKLDLILSEIFDSKDYSYKGYASRNVESFFVQLQNGYYLVFVMERVNFDGTCPLYEYAVYSLTDSTYIARDTDEFKLITRSFPVLTKLDREGGAADFMETLRLNELFYGLVENVAGAGMLTQETTAQYRAYLTDMKKMKSPSVQKLYHYFSEAVPH